MRLNWEVANATAYLIEVSDNGEFWRSAYQTDNGQGETEEISFAPVSARYMRMFGLKRGMDFGFSLFDFEVRAPLAAL